MAMTIVSFQPLSSAPDHVVTVRLAGIPEDADNENTSVYLGRQLMPEVDNVDPSLGTLDFVVDHMGRTGAITVTVRGEKGSMSDTSTQQFEVEGDHAGKPTVNFMNPRHINPRRASLSDQVTLGGSDLQNVQTVSLGARSVGQLTLHTERQIKFRVPHEFPTGTYPVNLRTALGTTFKCPYPFTVD